MAARKTQNKKSKYKAAKKVYAAKKSHSEGIGKITTNKEVSSRTTPHVKGKYRVIVKKINANKTQNTYIKY